MSLLPPESETNRLAALRSYHILDSLEEKDFDDLTTLAAAICQVPIALISLVDENRQWFKSHYGLPVSETPVEQSFCAHAIASTNDIMIVEDARQDSRFRDNPLVTGFPNITFYAGVPLINEDGFELGTLCVIDPHKKTLSAEQQSALKIIARQVMDKLELKRKVKQLEEKNRSIQQSENRANQLNADLKISESQFRLLVEQIPTAINVFKTRELIIDLPNESMLEIWGRTLKEVINKPLLVAMPELTGQPFLQRLDDVITQGKAYFSGEEKAFIQRKGNLEECYFNIIYQPLVNDDGTVTSILQICTEVTQEVLSKKHIQTLNEELTAANEELVNSNEIITETQHNLEQALITASESEARFRNMAEGTNVLIMVADEHSHATYFNKAWTEVSGRSMEELLAYNWIDMLHPDDRQPFLALFLKAYEEKERFTTEFRILNKADDYLWLLATEMPRFHPDGRFAGFISSCVDITEKKKDEQRKNDFIGMVSHELKTPLTSLSGYMQMAQSKVKDGADVFVYTMLDRAGKQVNKMNVMVNGFLNMSRLESGKIQIDKQVFDMAELVKEAEDESLAMITTHTIKFAPVDYTPVNADRNKIGQVITNLISNAVKYSPSGSTINVACITRNNCAQLCVKDEGAGIAPQDQEKLFDRYYRVENNDTKTVSGFGIGLYLCKEIIQRHDGKIWVESEVGKGSAFYFSLPVV